MNQDAHRHQRVSSEIRLIEKNFAGQYLISSFDEINILRFCQIQEHFSAKLKHLGIAL